MRLVNLKGRFVVNRKGALLSRVVVCTNLATRVFLILWDADQDRGGAAPLSKDTLDTHTLEFNGTTLMAKKFLGLASVVWLIRRSGYVTVLIVLDIY